MSKFGRLFLALAIPILGTALWPYPGRSAAEDNPHLDAGALQPTYFLAEMSGAENVPPVDTEAIGRTLIMVDGDMLRYRVLVGRIRGATFAHIHCGAVGVNGAVGVTLFAGGPIDIRRGILAEGIISAPDAGNGCGWESIADVEAAMMTGDTYTNVHTETYPAGEIRGQIGQVFP